MSAAPNRFGHARDPSVAGPAALAASTGARP